MPHKPYIDAAFYAESYFGRTISTDSFQRVAARASDEVDKITLQRVRRAGLESFDTNTQEAIRFATCAFAEALATLDEATEGGVITASESTSGAYSYSVDSQSIKDVLPNARTLAKSYLSPTGLLYAGGCR